MATPGLDSLRIGNGFDVHAFDDQGDHVMLGGVRIPHSRGLKAHSDGDVALHALTDALLGALALGDIGHYFPDTDPRWKGADSGKLLARVMQDITGAGWRVANVDLTVICQAPKLAPHLDAMRDRIAALLGCDRGRVSVKATTTEKLGFTGRGEGIAVQASALLWKE
ncbi:2-C-methyl-D-erythritol 2,4-cyclodiphosphate synthase [Alloalcanivorax sp. C16-1]|uniref:2-C-methyl-D-erythritol 2,4-cyclodiphosphate synthase n=1 Tax=Alloalcanivorax sp. C16-1 TaxID=3390051 RepID=UPI00397105F3